MFEAERKPMLCVVQSDALQDLIEDDYVAEHLSALSSIAGSAVDSDDEEIEEAPVPRKGKSRQVTARSPSVDLDVVALGSAYRDHSHTDSGDTVQPMAEVGNDLEAGSSRYHSIKPERPVSSHVQTGGQGSRAKGNDRGTGMLCNHVDGNVYLLTSALQSVMPISTVLPQHKKVFISRTRNCRLALIEIKGTPTFQSQPHPTQSSADDEASRFVISIEHTHSGQTLNFKTRGGHSVGKVVSSACQKFGLDPDRYDILPAEKKIDCGGLVTCCILTDGYSAVLKLIVEIDGEDNEILSVCDLRDTMIRAGAQEGSKFILEAEGK